MNGKPEPCGIVVFGITGDLANRKLLPALYKMLADDNMPERFVILGVSRQELNLEQIVQSARTSLEKSTEIGDLDEAIWEKFKAALEYAQADFADVESYRRIGRILDRHVLPNKLFYCSVPPSAFPNIARGLGESGLSDETTGFSRIIFEKPFGTNLKSAQDLNGLLHTVFKESQIYRIDHFLGKETVQNMLALRFANTIFEPLWNRNYVDHVQITVSENLGVEGRGGFYEEAGVLRDIIQNHAMQLVCLTALEPPVSRRVGDYHPLEADALRDEKVKVIRALKPITDPGSIAVLGQYGAGEQGGKTVPAYRDEEKVSKTSSTPTYAALKLEIENWRWEGVPFYMQERQTHAAQVHGNCDSLQTRTVKHVPARSGTERTGAEHSTDRRHLPALRRESAGAGKQIARHGVAVQLHGFWAGRAAGLRTFDPGRDAGRSGVVPARGRGRGELGLDRTVN